MEFSYTYFEDEVRDGFFVPSIMKRCWAARLEILEEIEKICKKYDIQYFADWGTLLGAVRHGGFIPWDDDLDICMKREDYNKFLEVAEEMLPEDYTVVSIRKMEAYDCLFTKVINSKSNIPRFDEIFLNKFHGFPYILGVDIFPLDYIAAVPEEEHLCSNIIRIALGITDELKKENYDSVAVDNSIKKLEEFCNITIDRTKSLNNQLFLLAEQVSSLYQEEEAEEIGEMTYWIKDGRARYPKSYYETAVMMPFENRMIPVPVGYDAVLKNMFGDYRIPLQIAGDHEYPFYRKQEKKLEKENRKLPYKYTSFLENLKNELCTNRKSAEQIIKGVGNDIKERKTVVFLPYKASAWYSFESIWEEASAEPNCDVYVIPVPYYDKNADGSINELHYEGELFPDYVPVVRYDTFDFYKYHPDIIYIHNPYDEYNSATCIHPDFYSKKLQKYTEELVYIPYFVTDEFSNDNKLALANMEHYVVMPGVVYADKVMVQSENMRQMYIDVLTEHAGEATREMWEKKIAVLGQEL